MFLVTYIAAFIFLTLSENCVLGVVVQTTNGAVRGGEDATIELGVPYFFFKGIPYAEPPVGSLRFQPPVPKNNWQGIINVTEEGAPCIQNSNPVYGVEDCLNLNVYTPTQPSDSCELLPVMFWIYGGGFAGGNASYALYGPDYFLDKTIVVVTINYRMGILGFLSTGDSVVPGNAGLKDTLLGLKWVRDNIAKFCGDPNRVTIAEQSAGAVSVAYHLQSPQSQGLFHGAILESGVSMCLWGLSRNAPVVTKQIATNLGISTANSSTMVQGLQGVDVVTLQKQAASVATTFYLTNNPRHGFAIGPVSEPNHPNAFFSGRSYTQLKNGQFVQVPILLGFNTLEGTHQFNLIFGLILLQFDLFPTRLLPIDANVAWYWWLIAGIQIKLFYFGFIPVIFSVSNITLQQYLSDDQFVRPIVQFARLTQESVPVYLYQFSYQGGLWGIYNRTNAGVTHSEELGYLWRSYNAPIRSQDLVVRSRMVTMWTNFIKYSNPTPVQDPVLQNTTWSVFGSQRNFLDIGWDLTPKQQVSAPNITFWDKWYNSYAVEPYGTY